MDRIEQLPAQLARRNWVILALLLIGSLPFRNPAMSLGILAGGLIAIGGFFWLRRSLIRLLDQPAGGARVRYQFGSIVRLAVLALVTVLMVGIVKIHMTGLIIGLSVVIINLFWLTLQRAFR
ncbi:MAG: ATP synthase subunit I [Desulfuromonadales bacterium]